jgi:hypothetical protein
MTNAGRGETARSALLLLNVVRALAATTAQSVRLIIPLTESGGTLSNNHFLCCLRSTEMHSCSHMVTNCFEIFHRMIPSDVDGPAHVGDMQLDRHKHPTIVTQHPVARPAARARGRVRHEVDDGWVGARV